MIKEINKFSFPTRIITTYEHEDSFADCEVSTIDFDLSPLLLHKPVFFKDELECVIEAHLDFRYINDVLYTLKHKQISVNKDKHHVIMNAYDIKEDTYPLLLGECETFLDKELGGWVVYKKVDGWVLKILEDKSVCWVSPCKNFTISADEDGRFTISSPFYTRFKHRESLLVSLLEMYELPSFHLSYLYETKRYDIYLKTFNEKVIKDGK